ncbi:MAG TPA: response regulator [Polyangia bacterium]|nr:response regulator [Polyangia bacterium]
MRSYLIVDDNQAFAENLAEIVRDGGDQVALASSGAAALVLAEHTRFDALVSDMRMPVMGGAELVHRIRRIDPGLPAIVITAYTQDDDLQAARREGLLAVLAKPAPIARLLALLAGARRDGLVALVEDDLDLCDNLGEALREHGFAAVTAQSVLETERLGDVAPFCALVDLRVPGGADGEAMQRLAQKFPGLPMLVITAHAQSPPPSPHAALFHKPFSTAELMRAVERLHPARHA